MKPLLVLLVPLVPLFGQVIEGIVTNSATGVPVNGVAVTIESNGKPAYHTTTDLHGAFRIDGVKAGLYAASFTKGGYLELDAQSPARRPFQVPSGSDAVHLEAKLTPLGQISGRVLDANGDPLANAEVLVDGSRMGRTTDSDKDGRFSFVMAPGRYRLLAKPPSTLKPPPSDRNERVGWVPTYYPGVLDSRAAVQIALDAGAELWGNDIKLRTTSLRRVRGVVLDSKGEPVSHAAVRTARTDETLFEDIETLSAADGSFEFPALYDGQWSIHAEKQTNGVKLMAFAAALVGDRDIDDLQLRLTAPFTVRGTVSFDGTGKLPGKVTIFLKPPVIAGSQGVSRAVVDPGGGWKIDNVYPGAYRVIAISPGPPHFLETIRIGDRNILGQDVEFYPGSLPVEIGFASKGGAVHGSVEGCGSATVVLAPQDPNLYEPQFVQTARCSGDGRFDIPTLRPGDYYAFAFSRWEGAGELFAMLDQSILNQAVGVRVVQGQAATVELKVTVR